MSGGRRPAELRRPGEEHLERQRLQEELERARAIAQDALTRSLPHFQTLSKLLNECCFDLGQVSLPSELGLSQSAAAAIYEAREHLRQTQQALIEQTRSWQRDVLTRFEVLQRSAAKVRVALFGKTRAGKSTLMEALTEGDGRAIGVGRQHTTVQVKSYAWPRERPLLEIVDTPGIEGFQGDELAAMAEAFIEEADHIFFLMSDDAVTAGELERFGHIHTLGKTVTVVLNVKEKDLDLLLDAPDLVFDPVRLDGHRRRIANYIQEHFGIEEPEIIPVHARAAWEATQQGSAEEAKRLRDASRIVDVERRIERFLAEEALGARLRSPRDLLLSFLLSTQAVLHPFLDNSRALGNQLAGRTEKVRTTLGRVRRAGRSQLAALEPPFRDAERRIPNLVDGLIAQRSGGGDLQSRWRQVLREVGVSAAAEAYQHDVRRRFQEEMQEQSRMAQADISLDAETADLSGMLDQAVVIQQRGESHRFTRAAVKTGASLGAGLLAGWAILNFWNPTGWVAATAAAGLTGAVGTAGYHGAAAITDGWRESNAREVQEQRDRIISEMEGRLRRLERDTASGCERWLDEMLQAAEQDMVGVLEQVGRAHAALRGHLGAALTDLAELQEQVDADLVKQVAEIAIPEVANGRIEVREIARVPGVLTKILVLARGDLPAPTLECCIGRAGAALRRARSLLGGEQISFVDAAPPLREKVAQALHPARIQSAQVRSLRRGVVVVRASGDDARRAIGRGGRNVQMAQRLLRLESLRIET